MKKLSVALALLLFAGTAFGSSFYVPYLLESTGATSGGYNGDVFMFNTTGAAIDVEVYIYKLNGEVLLDGASRSLGSQRTTKLSVEGLLGGVTGNQACAMMVTSDNTNFNGDNIAAFAAITGFLPVGTAGYTIATLWKATP